MTVSPSPTKFSIVNLWNSPTVMTWMSYSARALAMLVVLPIILKKFSPENIVLWYLFSTIVMLGNLADFGFRQTFSRIISYAYGGASNIDITEESDTYSMSGVCNKKLLSSIVTIMLFIYKRVAIVSFLLMGTAGTWAVFNPIVKTGAPTAGLLAWAIIVVTTAISFFFKAHLNFLEGLNKISLVRRVETLTSLSSVVSMILILLWKPTILNLVIVSQVWVAITALRDYVLCRRVESKLYVEVSKQEKIDKDLLRKIWKPAWRSGLGGLMSVGVTNFTSVIYAQFGNSASVASYLLAIRIITQIREVSMAPFYSKLPLLAIYRVRNDMSSFIHAVKRGMLLSHLVFFTCFVAVVFLIDYFLIFIHSETSFVSMDLWLLIGWAYFLHRYGAMHLQVYLTTNHVIQHIADGISGTLFIGACWILSNYVGVYSIPIAMIIGYGCFYCWYSVYYSYKSMEVKSFWRFEKNVSLPFVLGFFVIAIWILGRTMNLSWF